jgi:hypothetical protein
MTLEMEKNPVLFYSSLKFPQIYVTRLSNYSLIMTFFWNFSLDDHTSKHIQHISQTDAASAVKISSSLQHITQINSYLSNCVR